MNNIIEYAMLRTKVAMIGASGSDPREEPTDDGRTAHAKQQRERRRSEWSLRQDIKCESTDEGPDQSCFEPDRDRDDDRPDQHEVWLGVTDPKVRATVNSNRAATVAPTAASSRVIERRSSARCPKVARPPTRHSTRSIRRRRRGAVSHGPSKRATALIGRVHVRRASCVAGRPERRVVDVSRETAQGPASIGSAIGSTTSCDHAMPRRLRRAPPMACREPSHVTALRPAAWRRATARCFT